MDENVTEIGIDITEILQIILGEGWFNITSNKNLLMEGFDQIQMLDVLNLVLSIITIILIIFFHELNYIKKCRGKLVSRTKLSDGQMYVKTAHVSIHDDEQSHEMKSLQKN